MSFEMLIASPYVWLAVAAIAAIIEAFSWGLVTMWFVVGALAAFGVAFAGFDLAVQLVVFLVVSIACLVLLRPVIIKYRKHGEAHEATPVGSEAVVVEEVDPESMRGRVETPDHMTWAALSSDGTTIEVGAHVRVVEQKSVKLVVERI